jgi:hypothetical protein
MPDVSVEGAHGLPSAKGRTSAMFNEWNQDPAAVASLLDVLAESLRDPSGGPKDPGELGRDLARMVEVTRKWAADHSIPPACIPEAPAPEVTNARAAEFLNDLAKVVRYLGPHATPLENMAEVVALLKVRQSIAAIELSELDYAIKQLFQNLTVLEETVGAVSGELSGDHEAPAGERFDAVRDTVAHAHETLQQIVAAVREVCRGIDCWRLVEKEGEPPANKTQPS